MPGMALFGTGNGHPVFHRAVPLLELPAEDVLVEGLGPVDVVGRDFEMHGS